MRFSLKRQLDPLRPAPNADLLNSIAGVEVVDDYTVRIKTKSKDGVLLNKLPMFVKILPPGYLAQAGEAGFAAHPVGTGPFVFERWVRGDRIDLKANPFYWMAGVPSFERLVFRFVPLQRQTEALLKGELDMVTDLSGLDTLKVASHETTKIVKAKNFYSVSFIFNSRKAPFSDSRLRKAVAMSLDARALIRYGAKGNGVTLNTLTMPGEFGHNPDIPGYPYDVRQARRLLAEAGYSGGLKIKIQVREEIKNFAKIIVAQLAKAGIEADAYVVSQEKQYQEIVLPNLDPSKPPWDGDIVLLHYVDPMAHVYFPYAIFLYSKGAYSLNRDREFDERFLEMTSTADLPAQEKMCRKLEELIWEKCLAFSPLQVIRPFGVNKRVRYTPHITGMLDFRYAAIEEKT